MDDALAIFWAIGALAINAWGAREAVFHGGRRSWRVFAALELIALGWPALIIGSLTAWLVFFLVFTD